MPKLTASAQKKVAQVKAIKKPVLVLGWGREGCKDVHLVADTFRHDSSIDCVANHTGSLAAAVEQGAILGAAKDGRFATATRADYAAAAAAVLTGNGHENKAYELGGDQPYTLADLAAEVARQSGKPVAYKDLPQAEYAKALTGFGLPEGLAGAIADADAGASRGELDTQSHDLSTLIGRPTTTLKQAVAAALAR